MKQLQDISLKNFSSYRIGGRAKVMYFPQTRAELVEIVTWHRVRGLNFWVHGGGANTLFPDGEVTLPIISSSEVCHAWREGRLAHADAGKTLDSWVLEALRQGLGGVECLSGIPGTLGGAIFMNAGAHGQEISGHLRSVTVLTPGGAVKDVPKAQCGFGYRQATNLRQGIILGAVWDLPVGDPAALLATRKEILARRKDRQPLEYPSAGSVFKRPPGDFASRLMDRAGLKGVRVGGAQVSEKHAGFIVNLGNASCADVLELIALCQARVRERFGLDLELEQCLCPSCPEQI